MRSHAVVALVALLGCAGSWPEPGVVHGEGVLTREVFFESGALGRIRTIATPSNRGGPAPHLLVAGSRGAAFLSANGELDRLVAFSRPNVGRVIPVDLEADGTWEFVNRGGGWSHVSLIDDDGATLWSFPPEGSSPAPDEMSVGDLDGDGAVEFVVGMNGGGGLRCFDMGGEETWRRPATNVFSVAVLDADGDGELEILHADGGPRDQPSSGLWIRDGAGEPIRKLHTNGGHFCVTRWPGPSDPHVVVITDGGRLVLIDLEGRPVFTADLPVGGHAIDQAVPVRLDPGRSPYLAAVRTIRATAERSALFVFEPDGRLGYAEIFGSSGLGLGVLAGEGGAADALLVGSDSTVWKYPLADS